MPNVLATLHPSPPRRIVGIAAVAALGGVLVWVALAHPPEAPGWRLFLLGTGVLGLVLAERMRRATALHLTLTREALTDSAGRMIARVEEIRGVERGVFAFKPSSGFLLTLDSPAGRAWAPGLWWRIGRRVGVGGVTGSAEGKYMAEVIAMMLAERGR
jgi:hypothetical protein